MGARGTGRRLQHRAPRPRVGRARDGAVPEAEVVDPELGPIRQVGITYRLDTSPGGISGPAPRIGEHTDAVKAEAEALRVTLRDVFGLEHVDAGDGWLIFRLPPSELGVHPAEGPTREANVRHAVSFTCDDIHATVGELRAKGIEIPGEPVDEGYGVIVTMVLPGGVEVQLYEPRHPLAIERGP